MWYVALSAALGAAVGASELLSRYRDEPMRALREHARCYLHRSQCPCFCLHLWLAFALLPQDTNTSTSQRSSYAEHHPAGFGAMAILRSKFFTLRTPQGEDIGIGPDAAVSAFLSTADRGVDRMRAQRRLEIVFQSTSRIPMLENLKDFIKVSLLSLQNLADRKDLNKKIDDIYNDKSSYPTPELKLQATCYEILVALGEYNFKRLINNLSALDQGQDKSEAAKKEIVRKLVEPRPAEPAATPATVAPPAASSTPEPRVPARRRRRPTPSQSTTAQTPPANATPSASTAKPSSKLSPASPGAERVRTGPTPKAPAVTSPQPASAANGDGKPPPGRGRKGKPAATEPVSPSRPSRCRFLTSSIPCCAGTKAKREITGVTMSQLVRECQMGPLS